MSELPARLIVDWTVADRVARGLAARGDDRAAASGFEAEAVASACEDALAVAAGYTGLDPADPVPSAELIDRRAWAGNGLATLAEAARPIEEGLARELDLPGPFGGAARAVVGIATGAEAGVAIGYAARRVLGQYDLALFGPSRAPRLLFVGANLDAASRELGAEPDTFLRWIALHETTHVVQFQGVPWLTDHVRRLAGTLIEGATVGIDARRLAILLGRALRSDPRALIRAALRGELVRTLADPAYRATLDRLQAVMSVIEGHAEHVMDAAAGELGADVGELRRRLDARRARRGGLGEAISRLLGLDLKLRQYERGKAFCDAVVERGGRESLATLWRSPRELPEPDELARPGAWLDRVGSGGVR